jgi:signal transduction histidine kinase
LTIKPVESSSSANPIDDSVRIKAFRSSSITLAIVFTVMLLCSIATLVYFMRLTAENTHHEQIAATIHSDIEAFHDIFQREGVDSLADILQYRLKRAEEGRIYALANARGHVLIGNFAYIPSALPKEGEMFTLVLDQRLGNKESRRVQAEATGLPSGKKYNILATYVDFSNGYRLLVGRNIPDMHLQEALSERLGWGMIILMICLAGAGFFIGDRVVYRINIIADAATYIMQTGDLSKRIPIPSQWDDLSKLAMILNALFGRVEYLMDEVRSTSDNIAHDLRTPLTRMKHHIETLHRRALVEHLPITDATDKLLDEMDHILQTFSALLRIRNLEAGTLRLMQDEISLSALLHDVHDLYEPIALEKEQIVQLDIHDESIVLGDKHLLFQACANIFDNAIKYAPAHAYIDMRLERRDDQACIIMHNSGTHVDEALQDKIFVRFFRTDSARTSRHGTGLGLSLSKAIIERHGGTIRAYNTAEGFAVCMGLPRYKAKLL